MAFNLLEATIQGEAEITRIMTASFNYDTAFYFGEGKTDGPPGYDDGSLATKVLQDERIQTWFICQGTEKVGCISLDLKNWEVKYFCLLPDFINQGIGSQVWREVNSRFGERPWFLETPDYSLRNHAFYKKLGFVKVREKEYPTGERSFLYEKIRN